VSHLVRQPLLLVVVAGVAVGPLACFEKTVDGDCPSDARVKIGNQCYRDLPDGFMPGGDGMVTIACSTAKDCPLGSMPTCGPQQQCVPCTQPGMSMDCFNNHPGTPLCGPGGACVQCLSKDDCVGTHQACDVATGTCSACKANEDCSSGLCDVMSGTCADSSSLLYVNNSPTASCSESGNGAVNRPYCTVQTGFNNAAVTGKTLIIFSSTYPESVTASSSTAAYVVTAIGVGMTPPVITPPANAPALKLQPNNGKQVTVTLDHIALQGATGTNAYGVLCTGDGTSNALTKLTLTRATVQGNAGEGIKATNCDVTLDRDLFAANTGGGIEMATSDCTITNVVARDNGSSGSTAGGFYLASGATRSIVANSTFVRNQNNAGIVPAGAGCAATPVFFNNVIKSNGKIPDTNGCAPTYSAFDGATGAGNADTTLCTSLAQLFVDPTANDFRPLKTKTAPCTVSLVDIGIDKAGAPAVNAPDHDYDGTPRPQPNPGMFDVGAYEAK
jgi:hypothetical protein